MVMPEHILHLSIKALLDAGIVDGIPGNRRMHAMAKAMEAYVWLLFYGAR